MHGRGQNGVANQGELFYVGARSLWIHKGTARFEDAFYFLYLLGNALERTGVCHSSNAKIYGL